MAANSDIKKGVKDYNIDLNNTYMTTIHTIEFLQKYFKKYQDNICIIICYLWKCKIKN